VPEDSKKSKQALNVRQEENEYHGSPDEVSKLLSQLNRYKTTDKEYAGIHYRVMKADKTGTLRTWVAKPVPVYNMVNEAEPSQQAPRKGMYDAQRVPREAFNPDRSRDSTSTCSGFAKFWTVDQSMYCKVAG